MALQQLQQPLPWPYIWRAMAAGPSISTAGITIDATGEKAAALGYVSIVGRATSKVLSAAGGGLIRWRSAGTATWANGGTSLTVGLQGIDAAVGPRPNPDGAFTVSRVLTGGDGNITSNATITTAMTGGSGTVTLSHNDPVAIVWDMTARAGSDSILVGYWGSSTGHQLPHTLSHNGTIWTTSTSTDTGTPAAVLVFDDGTLGFLHLGGVPGVVTNEDYSDATNPDERGLIFQVPFACSVDSLFAAYRTSDSNATATIRLYSDPTGTPTELAAVTVPPRENIGASARPERWAFLSSQVDLSPNVDYCVAIRATGSTTLSLPVLTIGNAADRALFQGSAGTKATRDAGTGAFTAESPAVSIYRMGIGISRLSDGVSSGGSYGVIGG